MGSVIDIEKCGKCGGVVHTDYRYKTGEYSSFCERCGWSQSAYIKRDEQKNWVRTDTEYPLDGLTILGIQEGEKLLWEIPVAPDISDNEMKNFLNQKDVSDAPSWMPTFSSFCGHSSIFRKEADGSLKQLMYIGNWFRFQTDADGKTHFFLEEAVWEQKATDGNGIIKASESELVVSYMYVGSMTKAEVIEHYEKIKKSDRPFDTSCDYVTFREPDTGELVCLYGEMPEDFNDSKITGACPLGGDTADNCADCAYSGDCHFKDSECVRREESKI